MDPATAAAEAWGVLDFPRFGELADADEGDVDAAGGHAFSFPVEAVADGGFGVEVEGFEGGDFGPIGDGDGPFGFGVVGDADDVAFLPFGFYGDLAFADVVCLGVEVGGEEEEGFVGEGEALAAFVDAAFAEEDGLAA